MISTASRLALAAGLAIASASAQTIAWGAVQPTLAPTDVSTNGTLVVAHNVRGGAATVHGVAFQGGFLPTDWNGYVDTGLQGSTTGNAGYDALLSSARAQANPNASPAGNPSAWGAMRLDSLAPLVPGHVYEIQVWYTDQRSGASALYDRAMTLNSAWGSATVVGAEITNLGSMLVGSASGLLEADPDNAPAIASPDTQFGSHCTGTFVYIPGGETYLLVQGSHPIATNNLRPHLNAFQLRDLSATPTWTPYGTGCPGPAGQSVLQLVGLPAIGGTFALDVTNVGSGLNAMLIGLFQTSVPLNLPIFVPGCTQLVSADAVQFLLASGGVARWSMPIPNNPGFAGVTLHAQAAELAAQVSMSHAGVGMIQ